jgi:hypothetical protein
MIKNAPHDDLPNGALAYLRNANCHPTEIQPRLATSIYSTIKPPELEGRTGYLASKSGNIVTSLSGPIFVENDVTNYFVWPGQNGDIHDYIKEYLSPTQVRVRDSETRDATNDCWMHAKLNLWKFHYAVRKVVFQYGQDVYVADSIDIARLTKAICVSQDKPANATSEFAELDDEGVIFNSNGIFLLDFYPSVPVLFKKNSPCPSESITDVAYDSSRPFRYDYTYAMSRMRGTRLRDRTTDGAIIMQQSGNVALEDQAGVKKDWANIWTEKQIGSETQLHGRLTGAALPGASLNAAGYWALVTDGVVRISIDGDTYNVWCDFSTATKMADVAEILQGNIRQYFPNASVLFGTNRFVVYSGLAGSTIDYAESGTGGGTDISGPSYLALSEASGASRQNNVPFVGPAIVQNLRIPTNEITGLPESHWTHYTIFRSQDSGPYGVIPRVAPSALNNGFTDLVPLKIIWTRDVRVAGAFLASRATGGLVTATLGEFEKADEGTPLVWANGQTDTICEYIDSKNVMVTSGDGYYGGDAASGACAIGGGRVMLVRQTGYTVTMSAGANFVAADERKTLFMADGSELVITQYVSPNVVLVSESQDRALQGATIDPVWRNFTDTTTDDELRQREDQLHIGPLQNRFHEPLPNCNCGTTVPGFLIGAARGESVWHMSQMGPTLKYLSGYYLPSRQKNDKVEGGIQVIRKMPNRLIVITERSTWGGMTNKPQVMELPEFGEFYSILQTDIVDARLGVVDRGSIEEVDTGLLQMRCSDGSVRQFDGYKYGEDLTVDTETGQDKVKQDLAECWDSSTAIYGDSIGYILWLRRKDANDN